jgi:hypothetical protein
VLEWSGLTSGRLLSFLEYLTILLFVSAGLPGLAKRYRLRRAAVIAYLIAMFVAGSLVALWWAGVRFPQ